jgi:WD40 repeat protein
MPFIDYYDLLQVSPKAHIEVIKSAYRTMMSKLNNHPDKGGDEERAKLINEAYEILCNEEKRKMYDQFYTNFNGHSNTTQQTNKSSTSDKINIVESQTIYGHTRSVDIVSLGNYNSIIASCHNSGLVDSFFGMFSQENYNTQVKMWDINSGQELRFLQIGDSTVKSLKVSCNNNHIAVGTDGFINIGDINTLEVFYALEGDGGNWGGIAFKDDLSLLAVGVAEGVQVINVFTDETIAVLPHQYGQDHIWMSGNGEILATSTENEELIHIWEIANCRKLRSLPNPNSFSPSVAINDTGKILAISDNYSSISFWDTFTGKKIKDIFFQSEIIQFSPRNKYFITGDNYGVVRLFNSQTYNELITFKAHNEGITSLCFSNDDNRIITGSKDKSIKIWDIQ